MSADLIEIRNVHKAFKNVKAVNGINMNIQQGEYVGLLGPNGAGKTTLIEMIEGLQFPDSGEIKIQGKDWKNNDTELHNLIGLSLQETKFMDKLTVDETLKLFASFYHLNEERTDEVLTLVNLESKRKTATSKLSGGQRQRLALGIALLNKPKILLLDEPTTGLDPTARREIWNILEELKRHENTSMILTTHYMEEAEFLCDRIVIMDKGTFIAQGTIPELVSKYGEGEIIEFTLNKYIEESEIHALPGFKKIYWDQPSIKGKLVVETISQTLPSFVKLISDQGLKIIELECRKLTLDDLFISMTGRSISEEISK